MRQNYLLTNLFKGNYGWARMLCLFYFFACILCNRRIALLLGYDSFFEEHSLIRALILTSGYMAIWAFFFCYVTKLNLNTIGKFVIAEIVVLTLSCVASVLDFLIEDEGEFMLENNILSLIQVLILIFIGLKLVCLKKMSDNHLKILGYVIIISRLFFILTLCTAYYISIYYMMNRSKTTELLFDNILLILSLTSLFLSLLEIFCFYRIFSEKNARSVFF